MTTSVTAGHDGPARPPVPGRAGPVVDYLHHAGGLPCVPRNLRGGGRVRGVRMDPGEASGPLSVESLAETAARRVLGDPPPTPGPRVLYGHSMGALVTYEICRRWPRQVRACFDAVVLAACAPWWLDRGRLEQVAADLRVDARGRRHLAAALAYDPGQRRLPVPVRTVCSAQDPVVPRALVAGWDSLVARTADDVVHAGSHLFHTDPLEIAFAHYWWGFERSLATS